MDATSFRAEFGPPPSPLPHSSLKPPRVFICHQGGLLQVIIRREFGPCPQGDRKAIEEFSCRSRLALLRLFNRMDFQRAGRMTFFTATYPDEVPDPTKDEFNDHVGKLWRVVERWSGQTPMVWRKEFEYRKSGSRVGSFRQHLHVFGFKMPFLPAWELGKKWAKIIKSPRPCHFHMSEIETPRKAFRYVSLYIAKVPPTSGNLAIVPNQATGRHWGIRRRELLPWGPPAFAKLQSVDELVILRRLCRRVWDGIPESNVDGFTLLGVYGYSEIYQELVRLGLTAVQGCSYADFATVHEGGEGHYA